MREAFTEYWGNGRIRKLPFCNKQKNNCFRQGSSLDESVLEKYNSMVPKCHHSADDLLITKGKKSLYNGEVWYLSS